ncbi:MAG: C_GCAxxG_C_C family protein [Dehalococcoidia bacterium]|nr:C_GCAxxG_C_C family protein [Dehalococcoidia bacterium]
MEFSTSEMETLDRIEKQAGECLVEMHGCARCALLAIADNLDLGGPDTMDNALRAGMTLSGGIAGTRNHCGALIGGIMAIGVAGITDSPRVPNVEQKNAATAVSKAFYRRFEKEIGHCMCRDIRDAALGRPFDTSDPDEVRKYQEAGGVEMCRGVVGKGARMAAEMIMEMRRATG